MATINKTPTHWELVEQYGPPNNYRKWLTIHETAGYAVINRRAVAALQKIMAQEHIEHYGDVDE